MVVAATYVSEMRMKSCASLCSCKRQAGRHIRVPSLVIRDQYSYQTLATSLV